MQPNDGKMLERCIREIVNLIITYYDPDEIYLFGSLAKGEGNRQSDIDMLVIKTENMAKEYRGGGLKEQISRFPIKVDLLIYTPEEWLEAKRKRYSFASSIEKKSKLLYKKFDSSLE